MVCHLDLLEDRALGMTRTPQGAVHFDSIVLTDPCDFRQRRFLGRERGVEVP